MYKEKGIAQVSIGKRKTSEMIKINNTFKSKAFKAGG